MKRRNSIYLVIASITLAAVVLPVCAAQAPKKIAQRTVALMTFRGEDPSWQPGASVSGVLIGPKHILASTASLARRHGRLFAGTEAKMPDRVIAAVRVGKRVEFVDCTIVPAADDAPFRVLEIAAADREKLGAIVDNPIKIDVMTGEDTLSVGVFAPAGLVPSALRPRVVPEAHAVALRLGDTATRLDLRLEATTVRQPLPSQMAGAGVWEKGQLVGVLLRRGEGWFIVGSGAFKSLIPDTGPAVGPDPPKPPDTPDPPKPPDVPAGPKVPKLVSPELNPDMARLIKEIGGKPVLDPGFIDHVNQDQADMAMAMLVGGQPDKALELIEDILFLTRGQLAEQLTYRRALALAVKGNVKEALQDAHKSLTAEDPQVAGRARMLTAALMLVEDGQFDGKPIADPATLRAAAESALGKIYLRLESKADDVLKLPPGTPVAKDAAEGILKEFNQYRYAWPGYFKGLSAKFLAIAGSLGAPASP